MTTQVFIAGPLQLCGCGVCDRCRPTLSVDITINKKRKKGRGRRRPKISSQTVRKIKKHDKVCRYCLVNPPQTIDHVLPWSRGGSNKQLNLVACCNSCNQKKGDRAPKEAGLTLHLPLRFFDFDANYLARHRDDARRIS